MATQYTHHRLARADAELAAVATLSAHFSATCAETLGGRKAHAHFEQWLWAARSEALFTGMPLPAVPAPVAAAAGEELSRKLCLAGLSAAEADRVCRQLAALSEKLAAELAQRAYETRPASAVRLEAVGADGAPGPPCGLVNLCLSATRVAVSRHHLEKLRSLHKGGALDEARFLADAFCVLARVMALQGGAPRAGGMQAACGPAVFDVLRAEMGVELEVFASPLNARFSRFCSAAADVDACFGSLGSFYAPALDERLASGAYLANPPYDASSVSAATGRIERLLAKAEREKRPLSFVVVVPHWPDKPCWRALTQSARAAAVLRLPQAEHGFCEGGQHYRASFWRRANHDSSLVLLQSPRARKEAPFSSRLEGLIRSAFNTPPIAVPELVVILEDVGSQATRTLKRQRDKAVKTKSTSTTKKEKKKKE